VFELSNVSIVVVSFNSEAKLFELLPSVPNECELIIVNNAPKSLPKELKNLRNFTEIKNPKNEGFGTACNIGASAASKDFLFLLNPDTILEDDCVTNLLSACENFLMLLHLLQK